MSNIYIAYHFTVEPKELGSEILIAQLEDTPFESFIETEEGFSAYIQKDFWNEKILNGISLFDSQEFKISYTLEEIEQVNWNEEWEKNFDPIEVSDQCYVRAPFHPKKETQYDIIIEPKMSFGTGHHETTFMMIQHLLESDVKGKKTLDMGCGTAILAILAEMRGAEPINAIDIDNWCYLNSIENIERNNCKHITVYKGNASLLMDKKYDFIMANINRNILLNDMHHYVACLTTNGILLLSGFYEKDIPFIDASCTEKGLTYVKKFKKNNWVALKYVN